MMKRRTFLGLLAASPAVPYFKPATQPVEIPKTVDNSNAYITEIWSQELMKVLEDNLVMGRLK